ncbi:MAG: DUF1730 domain-containing protein [Proteobacteria bacterium]|nr:DUF1730 domain-containing protein [Pseudomonadota bacterium]
MYDSCPDERTTGYTPSPWEFLGPAARDLGFSTIGVAPAGPVPKFAAERYLDWIAEGYHAEMAYMTRHRDLKFDVRHPGILADATTVVVAALPYGDGAAHDGLWRHVAAHARGRDYHKTVKERLKKIAEIIMTRFIGSKCRIFVDTAPVMERTWAILAGIGHLGKNGLIIAPGLGCRVLLGEIVCTSVPPPPGIIPPSPFELCRDCELCITACSTGAIQAPAVVDSSRCLSYWTIEQRNGPLPMDIARNTALVFGCDKCISICPHDRLETSTSLEPPPCPGPSELAPREIVQMDERGLEKLIAGTPLARTGPKAIRRNARALESGVFTAQR